MHDEELEEKGVLGATLGELREAFQQGRAGGDGGAASVVAGEARDVVSRAGREAEGRGRGPGRPRKPVPETSKPQAGGIGSAVGATLDAVTPGQLPIDGDGDERVFDNTPQERAATPAEIAASRAGGRVRQAAQSAVPGQGADGTRGSSPEGISQRIARSAGRMVARVAGPKPARGGPDVFVNAPELELFDGVGRPRPTPQLLKEVKENRTAVARLVPKAIKNLVGWEFRGVEDLEAPHTIEDMEHVAPTFLRYRDRSLKDMTDDERTQYLEGSLRQINSSLPLTPYKPRMDEGTEEEVKELLEVTLDRSPALAELVRRHGLPKFFVFDDFPPEELRQVSSEHLMGTVHGWHNPASNTIGLNGRFFDTDPDLPDVLPNEFGFGGSLPSMDRVVRHEMGHRFAKMAETGSGLEEVDPEREQALADIRSYFVEMLTHKAPRLKLTKIYEARGTEAARAHLESLSEEERRGIQSTLWMTTYGLSSDQEFYAELFAQSLSEEFNVREAVPQELRPMVTKVLGLDPWAMADARDAEMNPDRPVMPERSSVADMNPEFLPPPPPTAGDSVAPPPAPVLPDRVS